MWRPEDNLEELVMSSTLVLGFELRTGLAASPSEPSRPSHLSIFNFQTGLELPADSGIPGLCVTKPQTVLTSLPASRL